MSKKDVELTRRPGRASLLIFQLGKSALLPLLKKVTRNLTELFRSGARTSRAKRTNLSVVAT